MNDVLLTTIRKEDLSSMIEVSVRKVLSETNSERNPDSIKTKDYLDVDEVAKFLNLAKSTIYAKSAARTIPYMKKDKRLYFDKDELIEWLKTGKRKTSEEIEIDAQEYTLKNKYRKG